MSDTIKLVDIDVDGAIQEAHEAVGGATRSDFFKKAAVGGGALVAGGGLLGALAIPAGAATKKSKKNDVAILNYALTLEYLEAAFYTRAINGGAITGDALDAAKIISKHENDHVKALRKALGKAAVKSPKFDFGDTTTDPTKFIRTAVVLEDTGVAAYSGQAPNILQAPVLAAAASILAVEARHASRVRSIEGSKSFAPVSFDKPLSMAAVLKAVKKTGFIVG